MKNKKRLHTLANVFSLLTFIFASIVTQSAHAASDCKPVAGALMTNIGAIAGATNLGPVFGDLSGSVAATILGQNPNGTFNVQHYWVVRRQNAIRREKRAWFIGSAVVLAIAFDEGSAVR